eukprot:307636-Prorocentrum_minimum.AAC.2
MRARGGRVARVADTRGVCSRKLRKGVGVGERAAASCGRAVLWWDTGERQGGGHSVREGSESVQSLLERVGANTV